jgi:hypothetical protein
LKIKIKKLRKKEPSGAAIVFFFFYFTGKWENLVWPAAEISPGNAL